MQNKIYGNASSDGFGLYTAIITVLFGVGGVALANFGAVALLAGVPALVVLLALMAVRLSKWDVMSAPPAAKAASGVADGSKDKAVVALASWSSRSATDKRAA